MNKNKKGQVVYSLILVVIVAVVSLFMMSGVKTEKVSDPQLTKLKTTDLAGQATTTIKSNPSIKDVLSNVGSYSQSKCNNIDGDSDYDGVPDKLDQCKDTPFAMSIIKITKGTSYDFTSWQGANIIFTDISIGANSETFASVVIKDVNSGKSKKAGISSKTPLSLGGVLPGLSGQLHLFDFNYVTNPDGKLENGFIAIMATSNVNINTGCSS